MMNHAPGSFRRFVRFAGLVQATAVLCAGCGTSFSADWFAGGHEEDRSQARERWDRMRSSARLQVAQRHLQAGRHDDARRELEWVLATTPDYAEASVVAAKLWLELGELARARQALQTAAALSDDAEIDYLAGIVAQRYDDPAAALAHYRRAAVNAPLVPEYLLAHAEMLFAHQRLHEASQLLESRMHDFDGNAPMCALAARIHRRLGLREPAIRRAREAARLNGGEDAELLCELGATLVWAGRYEQAIETLEPVVEHSNVDPDRPTSEGAASALDAVRLDALRELARAYVGSVRLADALAILEQLTDATPRDAAAWVWLARIAMLADRLDEADRAIRFACDATNPPEEALLLGAYIANRRGRFSRAADLARRALAADDQSFDALCLLGIALETSGDLDAAQDVFARAIAVEPESDVARSLFRKARDAAHTFESAATALSANVEGTP